MQQRNDDWLKARCGKATSSRFADVLAKLRNGAEAAGRKNYRAELVIERLTGVPTDTYTNGAMQWGVEFEPVARWAYETETGNNVDEVGFIEHPTLACGTSPDGLVGQDGLIEIKAPNSATHIETLKNKAVPTQYMPQIQGQMWLTGRKWCDFVSYDPRMPQELRLFIKRVYAVDEFIKNLEQEIGVFLAEVDGEVKLLKEL